jgi:hypothetical protein
MAGITPAHRLLWRGQPYNITEVIEDVRKQELQMLGFAEAVAS